MGPSTSDLVVACTSDKRWFDLDAVRRPYKPANPRTAKGVDEVERTGKSGDEARGGNWSSLPERNNDGTGAPPLDHWVIPPGGYRGSHYAVFPPELCRVPIEAMCPRRVCRTCGVPSRRVVDHQTTGQNLLKPGHPADDTKQKGAVVSTAVPKASTRTTTAWTTCACPGTDGLRLDGWHRGPGWRPGIVLDPFGGSGTTGLVATGLGRDALLVDIDARNLDLARERLGMLLVEGDLTTIGAAA